MVKGITIDGIDATGSYGVNVHNISFFNGLTNVTVKNLMVNGLELWNLFRNTQNGRITNNNARWNSNGIYIVGSINNTLIGNMVIRTMVTASVSYPGLIMIAATTR